MSSLSGDAEDTAPLTVIDVDITSPASLSLEVGDTAQVTADAKPDPWDIDGRLYWDVDASESTEKADGTFEPNWTSDYETTIFTATRAGTGEVKAEYWYHSEYAEDSISLTIAGVTIEEPLVCVKGDTKEFSASHAPSGGTFTWSILSGDAAGTWDETNGTTEGDPIVFTGTTAGTGVVELEYTVNNSDYTDTTVLTVIDVSITSGDVSLCTGQSTVVTADAVPDPADIGGLLEWSVEWGSSPPGEADLEPYYSFEQETTELTALEAGTGEVKVEYTYEDETASDTVALTVIGLILEPDLVDLGINDTCQLTAKPRAAGVGTLQWSFIPDGGDGNGTFDDATAEEPVFTGTTAGLGYINCDFTYNSTTYSDSMPAVIRDVELTDVPSAIPVGEYDQCQVSTVPDPNVSDGVLTWSLLEGAGVGSFTPQGDTHPVLMAQSAGTTIIGVRYEGRGTTQGHDEDSAPCSFIKVTLDSSPDVICLADTAELQCTPIPSPDVTSGLLNWKLLDAGGDDVTVSGMFSPNDSSCDTSVFTASNVDTGSHTIVVSYKVSDVSTSDSRPVEILGELTINPGLALLVQGETREFEALNANAARYDTTQVTWSIDEGNCAEVSPANLFDTAMCTASTTLAGTCVVRCELNGNPDVYDTAEVEVFDCGMEGAYAYGSFDPAVVEEEPPGDPPVFERTYYLFPKDGRIDGQANRQFGLLRLEFTDANSRDFVLKDEQGRYCRQIRQDMYEGLIWDAYRWIINTLYGYEEGDPEYLTAESMYNDLVAYYDIPQEEADRGLWWETPYYSEPGPQSPIHVYGSGAKGEKSSIKIGPILVLVNLDIVACDGYGVVDDDEEYDPGRALILEDTNPKKIRLNAISTAGWAGNVKLCSVSRQMGHWASEVTISSGGW